MPLLDPVNIALHERRYVSVRQRPVLGIMIYDAGVLADPDASSVVVTMLNEESEEILSRAATRASEGVYEIELTSAETASLGLYVLYWDFDLSGSPVTDETYLEIGPRSPNYDALPAEFQDVVEQVWVSFADLFDSPVGGPHLQTYMQANFGRERVAQLLKSSVGRLNVISQPHQTYSFDGVGAKLFPVEQWGGLLEQMTYVEVLKHLRRSYVEQPNVGGVTVATLDRRDYMDRWGSILADEQSELEDMIDVFKMAHMGLGNVSVLVSGGVYGTYAPTRIAGSAVARPRYWARFY